MKYLLLAAVAAGALFLGLGSQESTPVSAICTSAVSQVGINSVCPPNVPAACAGMTFDHQYIGTAGNDLIRITGSGRWFIDGRGGDDFIAIQAFNGPNCIVGGSGIDRITASPFMHDICITNATGLAPADTRSTAGHEQPEVDSTTFCGTRLPAVVLTGE